MELLINFVFMLVGCLIGGAVSWCIADCYFKKSLNSQKETWEKVEESLLDKLRNTVSSQDKLLIYEERMKEARADYRRKGTPKYIIDTFDDLTDDEKAKFYDDVLMREKGKPGKNNPYK